MMGKTHKAGGALAMLLAFQYMRENGYLVDTIHPIVQLLIMYPACSWGSTAPDLDQNADAIPEKTPVSIMIHKLIHLSKVNHRSWQTHSIVVTGGFVALLFFALSMINKHGLFGLDPYSITLLKLMLMGVTVGIASHLILDAFTYEGIQTIPPTKDPKTNKKKRHWLRFVPHRDAFKTNTKYETFVRTMLYIAIVGYGIYMIAIYKNII